ncbi:MAG: dTMP kinase [Planctomycetota bacterium]
MTKVADKLRGAFLVMDGPDGAGKGTQLERFEAWIRELGVEVVRAQDPGGTAIGRRIREILLDPACGEMTVTCETMLYMASRAQLVAEVVRPALTGGACVVGDRFVSSTVAYQGAGGADTDAIRRVADVAVGPTRPDLTILLDLDPAAGLGRLRRTADRIEAKGLAYHRRVRDGFLRQAAAEPDRFAVIDAGGSVETVAERVREAIIAWAGR